MSLTKLPWWQTDDYEDDFATPQEFDHLAGPNGVALVRAWPDGRTSEGWGLAGRDGGLGFIPRYLRGDFLPRRHLYGYDRDKWNFAFVMRSLRVVAIDIDGKNGGFEQFVKLMPNPPYTLAETSKSGNGYHLFFETRDNWSPTTGFGRFGDSIGIVQGVDVRDTGCVYHHKQQRWNGRPIAKLPQYLDDILLAKAQQQASRVANTLAIATLDDLEKLLMHDDLLLELAKPIPAGKRNNTLFAIGAQMMAADIEDWETKVHTRAEDVGLSSSEAAKLVQNIAAYGGSGG